MSTSLSATMLRMIVLLAGFAITLPTQAANRAFVVGNGNYTSVKNLPNPSNDARDMATKLTSLGYQVTLGVDLSRRDFLNEFRSFAGSLQSNDLALFFYAGHGLQIGGENYLFPVDAVVRDEDDARASLVSLNSLLADLSREARTRIVILDACRNNPFTRQIERSLKVRSGGLSRGLARVYAGVGSFIAFSTQPGNVAADGTDRNSPFTQSLLRHISARRTDVHAVMRRVRADVQRSTNARQIPWENSSLIEEVAFANGIHQTAATISGATGSSDARQVETYHFVDGLDPNGDKFLALKAGPGLRHPRLATMGPNTLLKIVEERGVWKRVVLTDGAQGWAHGNWISCCKTIARSSGAVSSLPSPPRGETCESLWRARNAIWHRHSYCFTGAKGQRIFGNSGCFRNQSQARAAMSSTERSQINAIASRERAQGCR